MDTANTASLPQSSIPDPRTASGSSNHSASREPTDGQTRRRSSESVGLPLFVGRAVAAFRSLTNRRAATTEDPSAMERGQSPQGSQHSLGEISNPGSDQGHVPGQPRTSQDNASSHSGDSTGHLPSSMAASSAHVADADLAEVVVDSHSNDLQESDPQSQAPAQENQHLKDFFERLAEVEHTSSEAAPRTASASSTFREQLGEVGGDEGDEMREVQGQVVKWTNLFCGRNFMYNLFQSKIALGVGTMVYFVADGVSSTFENVQTYSMIIGLVSAFAVWAIGVIADYIRGGIMQKRAIELELTPPSLERLDEINEILKQRVIKKTEGFTRLPALSWNASAITIMVSGALGQALSGAEWTYWAPFGLVSFILLVAAVLDFRDARFLKRQEAENKKDIEHGEFWLNGWFFEREIRKTLQAQNEKVTSNRTSLLRSHSLYDAHTDALKTNWGKLDNLGERYEEGIFESVVRFVSAELKSNNKEATQANIKRSIRRIHFNGTPVTKEIVKSFMEALRMQILNKTFELLNSDEIDSLELFYQEMGWISGPGTFDLDNAIRIAKEKSAIPGDAMIANTDALARALHRGIALEYIYDKTKEKWGVYKEINADLVFRRRHRKIEAHKKDILDKANQKLKANRKHVPIYTLESFEDSLINLTWKDISNKLWEKLLTIEQVKKYNDILISLKDGCAIPEAEYQLVIKIKSIIDPENTLFREDSTFFSQFADPNMIDQIMTYCLNLEDEEALLLGEIIMRLQKGQARAINPEKARDYRDRLKAYAVLKGILEIDLTPIQAKYQEAIDNITYLKTLKVLIAEEKKLNAEIAVARNKRKARSDNIANAIKLCLNPAIAETLKGYKKEG